MQKNKDQAKYKEKMNVLFIGLDSVSASSFLRALPKTLNFLKGFENFYHFKKFHASGPGTTYNMVPALSGNL